MFYIKYVNTIHIMSGVPGSGKSSFIERNKATYDLVLSRDKWRDQLREEMNSKDYFPVPNLAEWMLWIEYLRNSILNEAPQIGDIWIDQTSCSTGSIIKLINELKAVFKYLPFNREYNIEVDIMDVPLDVCLERNSGRQGRAVVPEDVIKSMWNHRIISNKNVRNTAYPYQIDFMYINQHGHPMNVQEF